MDPGNVLKKELKLFLEIKHNIKIVYTFEDQIINIFNFYEFEFYETTLKDFTKGNIVQINSF